LKFVEKVEFLKVVNKIIKNKYNIGEIEKIEKNGG
jgi:hypothetical protein